MKAMNNYIKPLGVTALLVLAVFQVRGQQQPVFSQYNLNKYLFNPSLAGVDGYTSLGFTARQQYSGFKNPPSTFAFTAQTRLLDDSYIMHLLSAKKDPEKASRRGRIGLGVNFYNDHNGIVNRSGFQITYAYHINFNDKAQISMGLSACGFQFKLNDDGAVITDQDDPLLRDNRHTFFVPDFNFGTYILTDNVYGGFSISDLLGSYLKLGRYKFEDYRTLRHYYFVGGCKFYPIDDLKLDPSFLIQTTREEFQADINLTATYKKDYWLGISYRTNKTLSFMAGLNINLFYLGYAYDVSMSEVQRYTSGSHEVMFGVQFGSNSARRIRWISKDVKTFEN